MPLLIDENISPKLATRVGDLHPGSRSVEYLQMLGTGDVALWDYAKIHGYAIFTRDADFVNLSRVWGPPPKVIQLGIENCTTEQIESLLRWRKDAVQRFLDDPELACLILT